MTRKYLTQEASLSKAPAIYLSDDNVDALKMIIDEVSLTGNFPIAFANRTINNISYNSIQDSSYKNVLGFTPSLKISCNGPCASGFLSAVHEQIKDFDIPSAYVNNGRVVKSYIDELV